MGACAGKSKAKRSKSYEQTLDSTKQPELKKQDDQIQSDTSPNISKNLPSTNGMTVNDNNDKDKSNSEDNFIDPEIRAMVNRQDGISNALAQIYSSRVISVNDSEIEYELAKLVYGNPENDYAENPLYVTTIKSTEV